MKKQYGILALFLAVAMSFSGCSWERREGAQTEPPASAPTSANGAGEEESQPPTVAGEPEPRPSAAVNEPEQEPGERYIDQVVRETVAKFTEPGMSEYDMAKAAFDYIIETTYFTEAVGLELWRIRGNGDALPSFVENKCLSVLLYGIGECEDYAAALTMLLRGMGLEAEYVPGLTYSATGEGLVDHSWTVAKIDGVWYHLDCQLEDNISRRDTTRYKYFMRGDATMAGSHRWGQNLIDSRLLTAAQNEEIAQLYTFEPCPQDYPTPPPRTFTSAPQPDREAIEAEIQAEFRTYENEHGPLEPLELNLTPPLFGWEGYGPPD